MRSRQLWLFVVLAVVAVAAVVYFTRTAPAKPRAVTPLPPATDAARSAAAASNDFAFRLYGKLRTRPGNLFLSPSSIHSALAMAREGAGGKTAEELDALLGLTPDLRKAQRDLHQRFRGMGYNGFTLSTGNRLWPDARTGLKEEFTDRVVERFFVGVSGVDFPKPETAAATINGWTKTKTGRIDDVVSAADISQDTALILTTAVHFKGDWDIPFKRSATAPGDFFPAKDPASKVTATFMSHSEKKEELRFADIEADKDTPTVRALELQYAGEELSMLVLLPEPGELADLEARLTAVLIEKIARAVRETRVPVHLPRFRFDDAHDLASTISGMGAPAAFSRTDADFSAVSATPLYLSAMRHKSFIEVNEEGTEAAAVTALHAAAKTAVSHRAPEFIANRPFLFLIRDRGSNLILFLGRVMDPTK